MTPKTVLGMLIASGVLMGRTRGGGNADRIRLRARLELVDVHEAGRDLTDPVRALHRHLPIAYLTDHDKTAGVRRKPTDVCGHTVRIGRR